MMVEITVQDLEKRLKNGENLFIIDVREAWEYDEANMGVLNIPLGDLPKRLDEIAAHKNDEIIVHCQSGRRSLQAQKYLTKQGFSDVKSLSGGIAAWQEVA